MEIGGYRPQDRSWPPLSSDMLDANWEVGAYPSLASNYLDPSASSTRPSLSSVLQTAVPKRRTHFLLLTLRAMLPPVTPTDGFW